MANTTLALNQLHFGHEAEPPINARKVGRENELEPLAASIRAHGLGVALNVRQIGGEWYVADGNRRLAALRLLAKNGDLAEDAPIKVDTEIGAAADELSLALNIERLDMHEADIYEKLRDLHDRGLTREQLASRFGIALARVHRMLALGQLHPDILEAWRNDEFQNPAEVVKAFTLAPSPQAQGELYHRLKSKGQLSAYTIRQTFGAGNREAKRLLTFVGIDAYEKAGGRITTDLFGDDHAISDFDLLQKCAEQRLADEKAALLQVGWAWVELDDDVPSGYSYSWERLKPSKLKPTEEQTREEARLSRIVGKKQFWELDEGGKAAHTRLQLLQQEIQLRSFTPKQRAEAGVVLDLDHQGILRVNAGYVKPKPVEKQRGEDGKPLPAAISNAMASRLSIQMARAVKKALPANPHTALAAVLAGLGSSGYGLPMMVRCEGNVRSGLTADESGNIVRKVQYTFGELLERYLAMSTEELLNALAHEAGEMVNFHTNYATQPILSSASHSKLAEALEPDALQEALRESFDATDYFGIVQRTITQQAICEALGEDAAKAAAKLKKADLVEFAVKNVVPTGWLPPELRTSTYAGPGAQQAEKPDEQKEAA